MTPPGHAHEPNRTSPQPRPTVRVSGRVSERFPSEPAARDRPRQTKWEGYLVATAVGLRRREIKLLRWSDFSLDGPKPCVQLRAETTKAYRADAVPIVPILGDALRAAKAQARDRSGLVFPRGVPKPSTLAKDLVACGIPVQDERGFRVDFHALKHTYTTFLGNVDISDAARMYLSRHRSMKMTNRYTDPVGLPLHEEMAKFGNALASSIASLKSGKIGQNEAKLVQTDDASQRSEIIVTVSEKTDLAQSVQLWAEPKVAERLVF